MTALADQARNDAEMQRILHDAAIGHRTAARLINELRGASITSEKSVRRYRRNRATGDAPKPQPRLPASGWTPGMGPRIPPRAASSAQSPGRSTRTPLRPSPTRMRCCASGTCQPGRLGGRQRPQEPVAGWRRRHLAGGPQGIVP